HSQPLRIAGVTDRRWRIGDIVKVLDGLGSEESLMATPKRQRLILDFTPPVLLRLMQEFRRHMRYFVYQPRGDGYDDDEYARLIVTNKLRAVKSEPYDNRSGHLILPLIVSQFFNESLTVLDFGGGAATALFSILDHVVSLDAAKFSYV